MGKVIIIKGADFSSNSIGKLRQPVFVNSFVYDISEGTESADTAILWRKWIDLKELPQGEYELHISVSNYRSPNNMGYYAYAIRIVDSNTERTGTDIFINSDSTTEVRENFTLTDKNVTIGQNKWLYMNINTIINAEPPTVQVAFYAKNSI